MLKKINIFRRRFMGALTKNVGKSFTDKRSGNGMAEMKRILIIRPNHRLGNLLLITPLLQDIELTFPGCRVDLFVKGGLAPILFKNYSSVAKIISLPKKPFKELGKYIKVWISLKRHTYDLVINLDRASSSGRLATQYVAAKNKYFGEHIESLTSQYPDYRHMGKNPVYNFRYFLGQMGFAQNHNGIPALDIKLSSQELADGRKLLNQIAPETKPTIAIFTFATGAKCYDTTWWGEYFGKLQGAFPDYNLIEVLPVENVSQINFKAPSFYSKDVREIASVIAGTALFIGADSGIMHLAASSQATVLGLFSVTDTVKYEPYGNNSVGINTNSVNMDESIAIAKDILSKRRL